MSIEEKLRETSEILLRSENRRNILREIVKEKVISTSELAARTGLTRQAILKFLKELEEAGLVNIKKNQKPWIVVSTPLAEEVLFEIPMPRRVPKKYPCRWLEFPQCLVRDDKLKLTIIWGSRGYTVAKIHDAIGVPELVLSLTKWFLSNGGDIKNIEIVSAIDNVLLRKPEILEENILLIGSGVVNIVSGKLMEALFPPIRFEPPSGREIYSTYTNTFYSASHPVYSKAGLIGLFPNPWNPEKVAVVVAGIFKTGTVAGIRLLRKHVENTIRITDHPQGNIPVRILRSTSEGEDDGFFE
ncbi:MAG: hypothetical protein DRJ35_02530 [Thermoprotei archaeon]|nr:MAG: hypothetical protein DRJ35_02530 [Thermoprotei archaeon]